MIRRFLQRRAVRRFLANRLAVGALAVIIVYCAIAVVFSGYTTFANPTVVDTVVASKRTPGFWGTSSPEKRAEDCEGQISKVEKALKKSNAEEALADISYGVVKVADVSPDELRQRVEQAWEVYDELAESEDLNEAPELLPKIELLEERTAALYTTPQGFDVVKRWFELSLGTDAQGRSIAIRAFASCEIAIKIGVVVGVFTVLFGSILGISAAYFGGVVDYVVTWLFTTFSSIPNLVLLVLLAYMFTGTIFEGTLIPMYISFGLTYWIGPCRTARGETMKIRELEYVQAATAIGLSRWQIMLRHILPNVSHLMLINFSLMFIASIKGEVILTFLGLGLKQGASWGIMIDQSRPEVSRGFFWQIGSATALMFGLVLSFNILSDALQDAFDPKSS